MATPRKTSDAPVQADLWETADTLVGVDLKDKKELEGTAFRITEIRFEQNDRDVQYAYVTAEFHNGESFEFNDSSKNGVHGQLVKFLQASDVAIDYRTGEVHTVNLVIPNGLRVSTFPVTDERGKNKIATTYYLTQTPPKK